VQIIRFGFPSSVKPLLVIRGDGDRRDGVEGESRFHLDGQLVGFVFVPVDDPRDVEEGQPDRHMVGATPHAHVEAEPVPVGHREFRRHSRLDIHVAAAGVEIGDREPHIGLFVRLGGGQADLIDLHGRVLEIIGGVGRIGDHPFPVVGQGPEEDGRFGISQSQVDQLSSSQRRVPQDDVGVQSALFGHIEIHGPKARFQIHHAGRVPDGRRTVPGGGRPRLPHAHVPDPHGLSAEIGGTDVGPRFGFGDAGQNE